MKDYTLLGIKFRTMTKEQITKSLTDLCHGDGGARVFTPNSVILYRASRSPDLCSLLQSASLLIPDGAGLSLACRLCGYPRCQRFAGIDAAYQLMRYAEEQGLSVYLLGGKEGVAQQAAANLKHSLPRLNICGTHHGYFDRSADSAENTAVLSHIRAAAPQILFVCLGFPFQEQWIEQNAHCLPTVKVLMGLGGSLDVWAGRVRRAPRLMQRAGLEWLWRCALQPRRIREVMCLPLFLVSAVHRRQN